MLRQRKSLARSQRKVVRKDQLQCRRSLHHRVYLEILIRENLFYVNKENGIETRQQSLQRHLATHSNSGKKGSTREELSQSVHLMSVVPCAPNSGKDHMRRPCIKNDAPAKQHGIWRNTCTSSRIRTKLRSVLLLKVKAMPAPSSKRPEEREFVVDSGASVHKMSKKELSSDELDTLRRSRTSTVVLTANGEMHHPQGSTSFRSGFNSFVTVQITRGNARSPIAWKTLRRPRIFL